MLRLTAKKRRPLTHFSGASLAGVRTQGARSKPPKSSSRKLNLTQFLLQSNRTSFGRALRWPIKYTKGCIPVLLCDKDPVLLLCLYVYCMYIYIHKFLWRKTVQKCVMSFPFVQFIASRTATNTHTFRHGWTSRSTNQFVSSITLTFNTF